jgi:hypothetical protein
MLSLPARKIVSFSASFADRSSIAKPCSRLCTSKPRRYARAASTRSSASAWRRAHGRRHDPPTCSLIATIPGPPKQIQVEVQDTGSGVATINDSETNAVAVVSSFVSGDITPILVSSTKVNQSLASSLKLTVTDVAGNTTICDPVVPGSLRHAHARASHRWLLRLFPYLLQATVRR